MEITPIKDKEGNVISFTVSGGVNLKTLLNRFIERETSLCSKCLVECDVKFIENEVDATTGSYYQCPKCSRCHPA